MLKHLTVLFVKLNLPNPQPPALKHATEKQDSQPAIPGTSAPPQGINNGVRHQTTTRLAAPSTGARVSNLAFSLP